MRWSFRVGRLAGAEIRVHVTLLLLLGLLAAASASADGAAAAVAGTVFIVLLFASVLLHELGHVVAARHYGIPTPDITLLPIGGVARLKRIPREPRQELVVAMAGPAVTLAIALGLGALLAAAGELEALAAGGEGARNPAAAMAAQLAAANAILLGFNLLPAFPMDGGRALRAMLAMRMDYVAATRAASVAGQAFAVLFGVAGVLYNPLLLLIAAFVFVGARQERAAAELQAAAGGLSVAAAMMTDFRVLGPGATLGEAAEALLATPQHDFPVVDADGRLLGVLTRAALVEGLTAAGPDAAVTRSMAGGAASLPAWAALEEAYVRMQELRGAVLPVTDGEGRLVGLLTPENLGEMVLVRGALARGGRGFRRAPPA
jgi:Zn-dependent protease/CBS domain-containing protein